MSVLSRLESIPLAIKTFLLLLALFFIYGLNYHFFDELLPIHAWRKADTLSLSWNYYQGASFLNPQTNQISYYGYRNAAAEFPLIYYIVGKLWVLFGQHEWLAKLLSFLTLIISLTLFSSVVNHFLESQIKTVVFIGIIFSSPILLYYSDTLLPNVFAFVLLAAFLLFKLIVHKNGKVYIFFIIFLSLAVLLKVTVLISILTFAVGASSYYFFQEKNLFTKHRRTFILISFAFLVAVCISFLWYFYAINYNQRYNSLMFSTDIRPIWEVNATRRKEIWDIIWRRQFNLLYNYWVLIPTILFVFFLAIRAKISSVYYWIFGIGLFGVSSYLVLWFWVFDVHDYYLIEMLFFPLLFFFLAIKYFDSTSTLKGKASNYLACCALILVFLQAVSYTHVAFGKKNFITKNTILVNEYTKTNWEEIHWYHSEHLQKLQKQKYEIQKIIKEKDTVFCLTDQSPNVDLYTIERIGFSNYTFLKTKSYPSQIPEFIKKGARYMLVVGNEPIDSLLKQFTKDTVYAKNSVFIFDLKSNK